jgi:hypothetical protein
MLAARGRSTRFRSISHQRWFAGDGHTREFALALPCRFKPDVSAPLPLIGVRVHDLQPIFDVCTLAFTRVIRNHPGDCQFGSPAPELTDGAAFD